jgi:hypothetical protein
MLARIVPTQVDTAFIETCRANLAGIRDFAKSSRTIPLPAGFDQLVQQVQELTEVPIHLLHVERDAPDVRVARGVALLDKRVPRWRDWIDADRLDVQSPRCILGQLYGAYIDGHIALGLGPAVWIEGAYYGFVESSSQTAREIEACWRAHITSEEEGAADDSRRERLFERVAT